MRTTFTLLIRWGFMIPALITCFGCEIDPFENGWGNGWAVDPAPTPRTYSVSGQVTYPDGTPVDSAVVEAANDWGNFDKWSRAYTDVTGHYVLNGVYEGNRGIAAGGTQERLWDGSDGWLIYSIQGNCQIDFVVFPKYATPIRSEDRGRLSLRRYSVSHPHFSPLSYGTKMRVAFWIRIEPGAMSLDSVDAWTAYKIPPGIPWSDITITYLENCQAPQVQVSQDTIRSRCKHIIDDNHGWEPYKIYVPTAFFVDCPNGIAIVNRFATKTDAEFWTDFYEGILAQ